MQQKNESLIFKTCSSVNVPSAGTPGANPEITSRERIGNQSLIPKFFMDTTFGIKKRWLMSPILSEQDVALPLFFYLLLDHPDDRALAGVKGPDLLLVEIRGQEGCDLLPFPVAEPLIKPS